MKTITISERHRDMIYTMCAFWINSGQGFYTVEERKITECDLLELQRITRKEESKWIKKNSK